MTTYLTVPEIAKALRVSKMTVYRVIQSGELPAVRMGSSIRVSQRALEEYMAANLADYQQRYIVGPDNV